MAENSMKPRIRFKGYTDAWEQRKAETLFITYAEKGYPELPVLSATQDKGMVFRDDIRQQRYNFYENYSCLYRNNDGIQRYWQYVDGR